MNIATSPTVQDHQQHNQIAIPICQPTQPNLPRSDLLAEESRQEYLEIRVAFQRASIKGDWKAAEAILHQNPDLVRYAITKIFDTPLHFAAAAKSTNSMEKFVEKLVNLMNVEDLELQNKNYKTALSFAASHGNVKIAKIMLKKNKSLLEIPDIEGMMPLHVATMYSDTKDMVRYLYDKSNKMTTDSWTLENKRLVLQRCVQVNHFDVALQIVNDHPELLSNKRLLGDVLLYLARNTNALKGHKWESDALKLLRIIKETISRMPENEFNDILKGPPVEIEEGEHKKTSYPSRLLFVSAKKGNTRFMLELIQLYPELILMVDDKGCSIFHVAVKYREVDIYNLLYEIGSMKESITCLKDVNGNSLLHFAAKIGKPKEFSYLPGQTLQMLHELLWFKDVEQMMPHAYRQETNNCGETPQDLFTMKQNHLAIECEKWSKNRSKYDIVIATILAFTVAFTLYFGYNQIRNTHLPMFEQEPALIVFVIADLISLTSSSISVLISISILACLNTKCPFLESLPEIRFQSLATIFLSLWTMLVAAIAFLFLLFNEGQKWIPIMFAGFAGMFILYLGRILCLTYGSLYVFKRKKHIMS